MLIDHVFRGVALQQLECGGHCPRRPIAKITLCCLFIHAAINLMLSPLHVHSNLRVKVPNPQRLTLASPLFRKFTLAFRIPMLSQIQRCF